MKARLPDKNGHFGIFGGRYAAETLMPALIELEHAYAEAKKDKTFTTEMKHYLQEYSGRETPLYFAKRLTEKLGAYYGIEDRKGVLVTEVYENSPARKGGIKVEDVIVAVDGRPVDSGRVLSATIANLPVGKRTRITVLRNGEKKDLSVEVAKRTDEEIVAQQSVRESDPLGITAAPLSPEIANRFGYREDMQGIAVVEVKPGARPKRRACARATL